MSSVAKEIDELYPKTPWWTNLVAVFLTALATVILMSVNVTRTGGPSTAAQIVTDTALFLPHALILFGIFADMFAYNGAYSLASLFGILSIPFNSLLDRFWIGVSSLIDMGKKVVRGDTSAAAPTAPTRGGAVLNYTGCYVQGFEIDAFKSKYSSQTLTVTATLMMYYIIDLIMNKGIGSAMAPIFAGIILFVLQTSSMSSGGCFPNDSLAMTVLGSIANGLILSFSYYFAMEAFAPNLLPSKVIPNYKAPSASSLKVDEASGKMVDASGMAWTFAPDGSLIPDTCGTGNRAPNSSRRGATNSCPGAVTVN
jgi:hypothetical protein